MRERRGGSYRILFDQYSRYRAAADVLERLVRSPDGGPTILDVGSGEACLLETLLPEFQPTFVDPLLRGKDQPHLIGSDVFSQDLDGRTFEHVLSLDTLEHVSPGDRSRFVHRLSSLATETLIIGGPFRDAGDAEATDRWIGEVYQRFAGKEYSWLSEHRRFGLPSRAETLSLMSELGWHCTLVGNGHTPWLREVLATVICLIEVPLLRDVALELSEEFNRRLYPFDSLPPVYRWLIVGRRDPAADGLDPDPPTPDAEEGERRWCAFRQHLIAAPLHQVAQLPTLSAAERVALMPAQPVGLDLPDDPSSTHLLDAIKTLTQGIEADRRRFVELLRLRDDREKELEAELARASDRATLLQQDVDQLLSERQRRMVNRDREFERLHEELQAIKTSRLWRLGSRYWSLRRLVGRILRFRPWHLFPRRRRQVEPREEGATREDRWIEPGSEGAYDIYCFPIIDWSFRFQRPQQLSREFAAHGHRVFYFRTQFDPGEHELRWTEIDERVYEIQLPASRHLNVYQDTIDPASLEKMMRALGRVRELAGNHSAIAMVELPFWGSLALEARERWGWRVVYDCMDEHSGFATNADSMLAQEERLLTTSDLVVATSKALYDKAQGSPRRLLLPNATDFEHFHSAFQPGSEERSKDRPVVGYYGAIAEWFDLALVERAARERPDWSFVLIGSTFGSDVKPLRSLRNVHFLGERPYDELPSHLTDFDVALIPFKVTPLTMATNPVKFYEYLSAGKPVVAVALPELEPYRHLFYPVDRPEDFVPQIERALGERDESIVERRIELARCETWPRRYKTLDAAVRPLFERAVVIVLSYGNLEYLRLCLDSLFTRTLYPNFEVVVVDNASPGEVRAYLEEQERSDRPIRVIFNEKNLGFARANNLAIESAKDARYVVLLNDDTVVTRGWLGQLVRHLEANPDIGMIGPVTNWIGNEAKIEVAYDDIDDMEPFAADYVRSHSAETFDIPVLAMFCAAMRRSLFDRVGLLDERFEVGMFEDDDFSRRVQESGLRTVCAHDVFVHHWGKSSFGKLSRKEYRKLFETNRKRFEEKWGERWQPHRHQDPTAHPTRDHQGERHAP